MINTIMQQLSISATQFGVLASMYYYGYAGMQLPIAFVMGRWEMRTILCGSALLCALGLSILTYTHQLYLAMGAQFLIGSGAAAGFLCTAEAISLWFPKERYGQVMGISVALGLLGAVYGGQPIQGLLDAYHWQYVAWGISGIGCVIAIAALCLPSSIKSHTHASGHTTEFHHVFKNPMLIALAVANLLMVGVLEGFADVWAGPFLIESYGLSAAKAAGVASWIFKGMMLGSPILCFLAKYLGNYTIIIACGAGMSGAFFTLLYSAVPSWSLPLWFSILGVGCCYQVLVFVAARDWCPSYRLSAGIAFLNAVNMLGGAFFHPIIGFFIDDMKSSYTLLTTYRYALSVVPVCAIIGTVMVAFIAIYYRRKLR
ncbi:MFS transporter [Holospora curviuscula]|nr:MFS transporter [Holospora curviuscula]